MDLVRRRPLRGLIAWVLALCLPLQALAAAGALPCHSSMEGSPLRHIATQATEVGPAHAAAAGRHAHHAHGAAGVVDADGADPAAQAASHAAEAPGDGGAQACAACAGCCLAMALPAHATAWLGAVVSDDAPTMAPWPVYRDEVDRLDRPPRA